MPSLLPEFAGKVDLTYIDPPFDTGADFSFTATVPSHPENGEEESITFVKEPSIEASYCFIAREGSGDWIYAHISSVEENIWKSLTVGVRVKFQIAFSIAGPRAFNISTVGVVSDRTETQLGLFKRGAKS